MSIYFHPIPRALYNDCGGMWNLSQQNPFQTVLKRCAVFCKLGFDHKPAVAKEIGVSNLPKKVVNTDIAGECLIDLEFAEVCQSLLRLSKTMLQSAIVVA